VLYAVIVAQATNLGLTGMARGSEFTYQQLEWAWEPTLTAASPSLVDYHHRQPLANTWGTRSALLLRRATVRDRHPWARHLWARHLGSATLLRAPPSRPPDLLLDIRSIQPIRQRGS
jgi:hypothetical protein